MLVMARKYDPTELTMYVAYLIEQRREAGESYDSIAASWGTTKPHVSNIYNHLRGVGPELEGKLAAVLAGKSRDKLGQLASAWRAENPDWLPRPVRESRQLSTADDPRLAMVLGYHANRNRWSAPVQAAARGMQHTVSFSQEEWVTVLDALQRVLADLSVGSAESRDGKQFDHSATPQQPEASQNHSGARKRWSKVELDQMPLPEESPVLKQGRRK